MEWRTVQLERIPFAILVNWCNKHFINIVRWYVTDGTRCSFSLQTFVKSNKCCCLFDCGDRAYVFLNSGDQRGKIFLLQPYIYINPSNFSCKRESLHFSLPHFAHFENAYHRRNELILIFLILHNKETFSKRKNNNKYLIHLEGNNSGTQTQSLENLCDLMPAILFPYISCCFRLLRRNTVFIFHFEYYSFP